MFGLSVHGPRDRAGCRAVGFLVSLASQPHGSPRTSARSGVLPFLGVVEAGHLPCRVVRFPPPVGPGPVSPVHPVCHLPSVAGAVEAFFAGRDLAAGTCRTYRQAFGPLVEAVGADRPVTDLCPDRVAAVFEELWAGRAPATWNTRRVAIQAFASWCGERSPHLEAWAEEWRGGDYPPFEGLWSGFENGRRLVPGAGEYGPVEGRVAAPAVWVDGQWVVSYFSYCRVLRRMGEAGQACPDDPRPHVASEAGVRPEGSGDCVPLDLSAAEADTIRDAPVW